MPVSWNPTVTLLQKKRAKGVQNTSATVEIESSAMTVLQNNVADECITPSSGVNEGEADEKQNSVMVVDDVSLKERNETETSMSCTEDSIQNNGNILPTVNSQRSHDDSNAVCKDKEHINVDKTDGKRQPSKKAGSRSSWSPPDASYRLKRYQNQPMKIENYEPGKSSVVLQDSFINNYYNPPIEKPGENSKYTENKPGVKYQIRKSNEAVATSLSETSVHDLYQKVQRGGDIPLEGLRCPIPPVKAHRFCTIQRSIKSNLQALLLPSPRKGSDTMSSSVSKPLKTDRPLSASAASTCTYVLDRRTKDALSAVRRRELDIALTEARKKRLVEDVEINRARQHSDYFHPRVKSPVALNRYDLDDVQFHSGSLPTSPLPVERTLVKARALYSFRAQNSRELSLNKGDTVYILRLIDKNWYEGQRHGTVGLFPVNYVEVLESYWDQNCKGRGNFSIAKFDFVAEYPAELSFQKGDVLKLVQEVDSNWYEATVGRQSGLVPKAYVESFQNRLTIPVGTSSVEISQHDSPSTMSSTSSCLSSGMEPPHFTSSHNFQGSDWNAGQSVSNSNPANMKVDRDGHSKSSEQGSGLVRPFRRRSNSLDAVDCTSEEPRLNRFPGLMNSDFHCLHPDTSEEDLDFQGMKLAENQEVAVTPDAYYYAPENRYGAKQRIESNDFLPYIVCQALFPYVPQNEDELELSSGDIVHVTEIFDDGWYVGISRRTNTYGTFPGNYVQRLRLCHLEPSTI